MASPRPSAGLRRRVSIMGSRGRRPQMSRFGYRRGKVESLGGSVKFRVRLFRRERVNDKNRKNRAGASAVRGPKSGGTAGGGNRKAHPWPRRSGLRPPEHNAAKPRPSIPWPAFSPVVGPPSALAPTSARSFPFLSPQARPPLLPRPPCVRGRGTARARGRRACRSRGSDRRRSGIRCRTDGRSPSLRGSGGR